MLHLWSVYLIFTHTVLHVYIIRRVIQHCLIHLYLHGLFYRIYCYITALQKCLGRLKHNDISLLAKPWVDSCPYEYNGLCADIMQRWITNNIRYLGTCHKTENFSSRWNRRSHWHIARCDYSIRYLYRVVIHLIPLPGICAVNVCMYCVCAMYVYVYVYIYIYMHMHMYMYVWMYACMHVLRMYNHPRRYLCR